MKTFKNFKESLNEAFGKCPLCGSPNLSGCNRCPTAPDFDMRTCFDCGKVSDQWRIKPVEENEGMSANNISSGNIAGVGDPGVPVRKKLELVNGPAVDPRMFSSKIFRRKDQKD